MVSDRIAVRYDSTEQKWRVNIPLALSASGCRERRFFARKADAQSFMESEVARVMRDGLGGEKLTRIERDIAGRAFHRLKILPASTPSDLLSAVEEFISKKAVRSNSKKFKEHYEDWMQKTMEKTRHGKPTSRHYAAQIRQVLARLSPLHDVPIADITPETVEAAIGRVVRPEHKSSRNGLLRVVKACFQHAKDQGLIESVPVAKDSRADVAVVEPEILSPEQVFNLLKACAQKDPQMLGFYTIALFAGVRPLDELSKLTWEHVWSDGGKRIHVPATVSKTGRRRYVEIEWTLKKWLDKFPKEGLVVPKSQHFKRRREIERSAGIVPWPRDCMRHSYASYWMTIYRDEDRCRDNMGHRTKDQLFSHYRQHTTEEAAKTFWSLAPEVVLGCKK